MMIETGSFAYYIFLFLPLCVGVAGFHDMLSYKIPNILSVVLFVTFYIFAFAVGMDWSLIGMHTFTAFLVLLVTFCFFCLGFLGGGDAKILAASCLWIGWGQGLIYYMMTIGIAGGLLSILVLYFRAQPVQPCFLYYEWLRNLYEGNEKSRSVPYAIAIMAGLYLSLTNTTPFFLAVGLPNQY